VGGVGGGRERKREEERKERGEGCTHGSGIDGFASKMEG